MAEQVAVSAGIKQSLIALLASLTERQCDRTVRVFGTDCGDDFLHPLVCEIGIFSALKHKGAETEIISLATAGENLVETQAVAVCMWIATANSAVEAVIFAVVGKLNQSAQKDFLMVVTGTALRCFLL